MDYKQEAIDRMKEDFYDCNVREIPVDELNEYSTGCGAVDNECFSDDVITYLKFIDVNYILAGFEKEDSEESKEIICVALPIPTKGNVRKINKFSEMIADNDGSLYWLENEPDKSWPLFESE